MCKNQDVHKEKAVWPFLHFKCPPKNNNTCKCSVTVYCVTRYLFTPSSPDSCHAQCNPLLSFIRHTKKGEGRGEKEGKGTEALKDDESGRKRTPDGFLSWLSSRCSRCQPPCNREGRREGGGCGNADPNCSRQLSAVKTEAPSTATHCLSHFEPLYTRTHTMLPLSCDGCWS